MPPPRKRNVPNKDKVVIIKPLDDVQNNTICPIKLQPGCHSLSKLEQVIYQWMAAKGYARLSQIPSHELDDAEDLPKEILDTHLGTYFAVEEKAPYEGAPKELYLALRSTHRIEVQEECMEFFYKSPERQKVKEEHSEFLGFKNGLKLPYYLCRSLWYACSPSIVPATRAG